MRLSPGAEKRMGNLLRSRQKRSLPGGLPPRTMRSDLRIKYAQEGYCYAFS